MEEAFVEMLGPPDMVMVVGEDRIPVHSAVLKAVSSCAAGLPEGSTEFDVSDFAIDDGKVTKATVLQWLSEVAYGQYAAYSFVIEGQRWHDVDDLYVLLQFSDALGCSTDFLNTCVAMRLPPTGMLLSVGKVRLHLQSAGQPYELVPCADERYHMPVQGSKPVLAGRGHVDAAEFLPALHMKLEKLLYLAAKLELQPLLAVLASFIQHHLEATTQPGRKALVGNDQLFDKIYTPRVMTLLDANLLT